MMSLVQLNSKSHKIQLNKLTGLTIRDATKTPVNYSAAAFCILEILTVLPDVLKVGLRAGLLPAMSVIEEGEI